VCANQTWIDPRPEFGEARRLDNAFPSSSRLRQAAALQRLFRLWL